VLALANHQPAVVGDLGPNEVPLRGHVGQGRQAIALGHGVRELLHAGNVRRGLPAKVLEQPLFELQGPVLRGEHLVLVFLEPFGDVPLGVLDRLLADVVGRHLVGRGVVDLDVVPEHLVEADLEVRDAGPLRLLSLILAKPALAVGRDRPQAIQFGREPASNEPAVAKMGRAVGLDRRFEQVRQLVHAVALPRQAGEQIRSHLA
jgi:hypothetical protein